MEPVDVGFWSVVPPLIAIALALLTKEVIASLLIGIFSGTIIYALASHGGFVDIFTVTTGLMAEKIGGNASIIIFLALLGALVAVITRAGGSKAYGDWAARRIKSRSGSLLATSALGMLIFVDDYFNCLTVGTVMRPVTDRQRVSRAKLAYIIDATAAPVCIIAPISSWAASVISQMEGTGLNGMDAFVRAIPFNLYAILTIIMVIVLSVTKLDFGPMRRHEENAHATGDLHSNNEKAVDDELASIVPSARGRVIDLIIPIVSLIVACVFSMLLFGGYFEGGKTIAQGFGDTDAGASLALGGLIALLVSFALFVPRKVIGYKDFMESIVTGVKSMVPAFIILVLAWAISGVCRDLLNTGAYVGNLVETSNMPVALIPAIAFLVACFLSFSTGTSWGTFGILIPIIAIICQNVAPDLIIVSLSATLAGAVFGDHCSPISDTTILSSTGAGCNHIDHVATQMPYAITVAGCCLVGYIVAGLTNNVFLTLLAALACLALAFVFMRALSKSRPVPQASQGA